MLIRYLKPHLLSISVATIFTLIFAWISAATYSLIGPTTQVLFNAGGHKQVLFGDLVGHRLGELIYYATGYRKLEVSRLWQYLPLLLLVLATIRAIFSLFAVFIWERISELITKRIRYDLVDHYLNLDPRIRPSSGEDKEAKISSTITTDVRLLREYIVHFYGGLPRECLAILFYMITLVLLSPQLFLLFFVGVIPAGYYGSKLGKSLRKRSYDALQDYSVLTEWLQQRLLGIETIKHYHTEMIEIKKMKSLTASLFKRFLRAARIKARTPPILETVAITAMVGVLFYALIDVYDGSTTGSIQLSFFATAAILIQSASKVGKYLNSNKEGGAALKRIVELFTYFKANRISFSQHATLEKNARHSLVLDGVSVRYSNRDNDALKEYTYAFDSGKIYCLCGPSGAGKSTIFNVILGTVPVKSGTIRMNANNFTADKLPICYMPQNIKLAPTSIALNICYPLATYDQSKILKALDEVGMAPFIASLKEGIDTQVGREGIGVSGGQAQRILLARLFYHKSPVILMDEGTSNLDPEVEELILGFVKRLAGEGSTVIMIAHRLAAALIADEIVILEDGAVRAQGKAQTILNSAEFRKFMIGDVDNALS